MKETSGILGALFSLQKFAGSPFWPSWEELHYPAKHPFNNLSHIPVSNVYKDTASVSIISRPGFSKYYYIAFAMHLDLGYV